MTHTWRAFNIYHSRIDTLILECVQPFVEAARDSLSRCFWERHYAGGPHLRLRLSGPAQQVDQAAEELIATAEDYLAQHPSPDLATYSERDAAALLELETAGEALDAEDLRYRNNVVFERPYPPARSAFLSSDAADLMESFRHDSMPLAGSILAGERPRREEILRLYFLQALLAAGDLSRGSVSWKSHWEGFAATFSSDQLIERIRSSYSHHRETLHRLMLEVEELHSEDRLEDDAVLAAWRDLVTEYRRRAHACVTRGAHLTHQPATEEDAAQARRLAQTRVRRDSEFVRAYYEDPRFLTSIQHDERFLTPRVLTNLFYSLVAAVGLSSIDKMTLCHHAHRIVEDHFDCDLTAILRQNIDGMVQRQAARQAATAVA